jgi:pimeloyl-ACP methyl ester carboxylesterase
VLEKKGGTMTQGAYSTVTVWDVSLLSTDFRCIAYDQRGWGQSE